VSTAWRRGGLGVLVTVATAVGIGVPPSAVAQQPGCTPPTQLGLAITFDDSGSMSDNDPDELRIEGVKVALDELRDGSIAAAGSFDSSERTFFGPTVVDDASRQRLKDEVGGFASGNTDFDLGFDQLIRQLDAMPASVDRKAVVFLSDGRDNDGEYSSDDLIAERGVPIYTIAFGDADDAALREIAEGSGRTGKAYDAEDAQGLQAAFADIVGAVSC